MRIALIGYGKMGKEIEKIALQRNHSISHKINSSNTSEINHLSNTDVAIEFTQPDLAIENFKSVFKQNIPLVAGTTGWYNQLPKIKEIVNNTNQSFFYASNFSIGVNIFFKLNEYLSTLMEDQSDYSLLIKEIHHLQKLDAPSGTAISLAEGILSKSKRYKKWEEKNTNDETAFPIISKREPEVPGTHTIVYESNIDTIKIEHIAKNRVGFAKGAVVAAEFLQNKKGVYSMNDLLNL
jgi:4-hydroxy-tetrahydrodipicolinate reductase